MSRRNKRKYNTGDIKTKIIEENKDTSSIDKEVSSDIFNENNIIKIKRKCKPGVVNVNGVTYTVDSYNNVMNTDIIPLVNKGLLSCEIFFGKDNQYKDFNKERFYTIDTNNSICNKIVNIFDEYVEVEFNDIELMNIIKENIESASIEMRYIGDISDSEIKTYDVIKIIAFDIVIKGDYPYRTYIEFEKYRESKFVKVD